MGVAAAWVQWREMASLLVNFSIPLKSRAGMYGSCIRLIMVYGAKIWELHEKLLGILKVSDCKMLQYVAGV